MAFSFETIRRAFWLAFLLWALALSVAKAEVGDTIGDGLLSGDAYRYSTELDRMVYVAGASDLLMTFVKREDGHGDWYRCIESMDAAELEPHFLKWIKAHPEEWPNPAGPLFVRAVRELCGTQAKAAE